MRRYLPDQFFQPARMAAVDAWDQCRYAEAEWSMKRALAIDEKTLGPDHPAVGTAVQPRRAVSGPGPVG
jgi:hypothetical protein